MSFVSTSAVTFGVAIWEPTSSIAYNFRQISVSMLALRRKLQKCVQQQRGKEHTTKRRRKRRASPLQPTQEIDQHT